METSCSMCEWWYGPHPITQQHLSSTAGSAVNRSTGTDRFNRTADGATAMPVSFQKIRSFDHSDEKSSWHSLRARTATPRLRSR
jgi:hypothetical protein